MAADTQQLAALIDEVSRLSNTVGDTLALLRAASSVGAAAVDIAAHNNNPEVHGILFGKLSNTVADVMKLLEKAGQGGIVDIVGHNNDPDVHAALFGPKIRNPLTRDTTFYVRPDGNDLNDGSADTPAKALKTIAGALALLRRIDQRGYRATISLAPGNWGVISISMADGSTYYTGGIGITSSDKTDLAFTAVLVSGRIDVELGYLGIDLTLASTPLVASVNSYVHVSGLIIFRGKSSNFAMTAVHLGQLRFDRPATIHFDNIQTGTVVNCSDGGRMIFANTPITGAATGRRFYVGPLSHIYAQRKGPEYFPGTIDGLVDPKGDFV